jgi:hypothetical protein
LLAALVAALLVALLARLRGGVMLSKFFVSAEMPQPISPPLALLVLRDTLGVDTLGVDIAGVA